jgi:hypothetical protein
MTSSTSTSENELNNSFEISISVTVRFWLFVIPNSLSILCSLFVLYYLLFDRILRQALHNHVIIILLVAGLIYELTAIPFMLHFYRVGKIWKPTIIFARFWIFIDCLCYTTQMIGFAWATIERHILIFHTQWILTKKSRLFVYYLPLIAILIYCFTYYFVFIWFPFCEELIIQSSFNGFPITCTSRHPILSKWDTVCHQIIPTLIIVIFSISLLIRVLRQKLRLNRSIEWRQQRKITIQLLSISALYFLFNFPRAILQLLMQIGISTNELKNAYYGILILAIYIIFLFPFVCCGSIPEIRKKLKAFFCCRKQQRGIVPENISITRIETK